MDIEKKLLEIIQNLEKSGKLKVDEATISEIVNKKFSKYLLTLSNLSPEIKDFFEKSRKIELIIPPNKQVTSGEAIQELKKSPYGFKILDDVVVGNNVWLYGKAGTGKTVLAENIAEALDLYIFRVNCNQYTAPSEFIGGQTMDGYVEGKLIKAWRGYDKKEGDLFINKMVDGKITKVQAKGAMLLIDEIAKLDPNTAGVINDALAKTGTPKLRSAISNALGENFQRHDGFCCIATANTTGRGDDAAYSGNNPQDGSLLDRFSGSFYEIGYNEELERSLIFPKVYELAVNYRNAVNALNLLEVVSLRTMLNLNRIYYIEMMRYTSKREPNPLGKTLIDGFNSIIDVLGEDTKQAVLQSMKDSGFDYEIFKNTYRDVQSFESFLAKS